MHKLKELLIAIVLLLLSLVIGTSGFIIIEGYGFLNAFYMTVITFATVGFTEVHPLTDAGRIFTSFYILLNLVIFTYVLSVITKYLLEGELQSILKKYMSEKEVHNLKNHVIVCGYGRNGSKASEELFNSKLNFVIIEKEKEVIDEAPEELKSKFLLGDASLDEILINAGIEKAAAIIITTPLDSVNVFITLTARGLNSSIKIIARASEKNSEKKLYRAGANSVVMPEAIGGLFMAQLFTKPEIIEMLDLFSRGNQLGFHLEKFTFDQFKAEYRDKIISNKEISSRTGAVLVGFKDDEKGFVSPGHETVLGPDDVVIIFGSGETLSAFKHTYLK